MAEAIFYDRKHLCEVKASQICGTNVICTVARTQDDCEERDPSAKTIDGCYEMPIGELGYKSPECGPHRNWDRFLNYTDLVFLRFE